MKPLHLSCISSGSRCWEERKQNPEGQVLKGKQPEAPIQEMARHQWNVVTVETCGYFHSKPVIQIFDLGPICDVVKWS